jgi:hypothetical protein
MRRRAVRLPEEPQEPVLLYHYTSLDVLERVTADKEIWSSSIHYLNDGREFALALELADQALERALALERPCNDYLEKAREQLVQNAWRDVFVTSFSESGDLLSQWRAYCPAGRGVSIGFRKDVLQTVARARGFRLVRCKYDLLSQKEAVRKIVRDLVAELDELCAVPEPRPLGPEATMDTEPEADMERPYNAEDLVRVFVAEFARVAPQMKDGAFKEEREWRLIGVPSEFNRLNVHYRPGASYLVPYVRFPLPQSETGLLEFADMILGPTPHPDLSRRAIVNLLGTRDVQIDQVRGTSVPYRSW